MTLADVLKPSGEVLQRLAADRESRVLVTKQVPFFQLTGEPSELCPPGFVTVIAALTSSDLFGQVQAALEADDREGLDAAIGLARDSEGSADGGSRGEQRDLMPVDQAADIAINTPAYADVRYLGRTLISNVVLTKEVDFARVFLPYAGHSLSASDFQVAHFLQQPDTEPIEVLVVEHRPQLSAQQSALIRRIPTESREMLIGRGDFVMSTPAALFATVTAGLVGAGVGYAIGRALQHFNVEVFAELEGRVLAGEANLPKLPPIASVQELIAAKRDAMASI